MSQNQSEPLPDDTDEWIRILQSDDGRAAREHLEAGRPIYYREADTPAGLCIKKYPDGRREWIIIDRKTGKEMLVRHLKDNESSSLADALAQSDGDADFDFDPPRPQLDLRDEDLFAEDIDETLLDKRLAELETSTQNANDALDDALSSIEASNQRIDQMLGEKPSED